MNRRVIDLLGLPQNCLDKPMQLDDIAAGLSAKQELGFGGGRSERKLHDLILGSGVAAEIGTREYARPDGMTLEVHTMALPGGGLVRTISDVSERKRKEIQIAHMAHHDALTGLANRTLLGERIEQASARLRRRKEGFALFYIDLDRFKGVNDVHGHAAGDALLRSVADRLSACVRETDTVARLGGDEFAILQDTTDREEDAEVLARRILESVGAPYQLEGYRAEIGVSIGIAMAPRDGALAEDLFKAADTALYRVKSEDGDAYRFFGRMSPASPAPQKFRSAV
jgi:diguanylate cyclase (GGDEF)-like protein